jgi:hypothetical protein
VKTSSGASPPRQQPRLVPHLAQVAVHVAHRVRPVVLPHLREEELPLRRAPRPRHPGGRVDHHRPRPHQPATHQRRQRQQRRRRIASGVRHQRRPPDPLPVQLRQPVDRLRAQPASPRRAPAGPPRGRSPAARLPHPLHPPARVAVRQAGEHQVALPQRRLRRPHQPQLRRARRQPTQRPARLALRGGEDDLRAGVPRQQLDQLAPRVPGRPEHTHAQSWNFIHHS